MRSRVCVLTSVTGLCGIPFANLPSNLLFIVCESEHDISAGLPACFIGAGG